MKNEALIVRPWEIQPGETAKAFSSFCVYRDLGPERSLSIAADKMAAEVAGKSRAAKATQKPPRGVRCLKEWSAGYHWVERARAWDVQQVSIADEAVLKLTAEEARKMVKRHLRVALNFQEIANLGLQEYAERDKTGKWRIKKSLKPRDLAKLYEIGHRNELLAHGEPTEIEEHRETGDPGMISSVAIAIQQALALAQKAKK